MNSFGGVVKRPVGDGLRDGGWPGERGSVAVTSGIRVEVSPGYMAEQSDPLDRRYVYVYRVRVVNEGAAPVQLLGRRWLIIDGAGREREVVGDGVVGEQPRLEAGEAFEYASFCPLETVWGTMEGFFRFRRLTDGGRFDASVGRFYLVAEGSAAAGQD